MIELPKGFSIDNSTIDKPKDLLVVSLIARADDLVVQLLDYDIDLRQSKEEVKKRIGLLLLSMLFDTSNDNLGIPYWGDCTSAESSLYEKAYGFAGFIYDHKLSHQYDTEYWLYTSSTEIKSITYYDHNGHSHNIGYDTTGMLELLGFKNKYELLRSFKPELYKYS